MIIHYNPDDYEYVYSHVTCEYHKANPGVNYAGCCCSSTYTQRLKAKTNVATRLRP